MLINQPQKNMLINPSGRYVQISEKVVDMDILLLWELNHKLNPSKLIN